MDEEEINIKCRRCDSSDISTNFLGNPSFQSPSLEINRLIMSCNRCDNIEIMEIY